MSSCANSRRLAVGANESVVIRMAHGWRGVLSNTEDMQSAGGMGDCAWWVYATDICVRDEMSN
jgi:hypothetical protein